MISRGRLGDTTLGGVRLLGGEPVDVSVRAGRITEIARAGTGSAPGQRVDCAGLIMLPAFVDLHTHLREPGGEQAETIATGTLAAAHGGYSDVFAMANCDPATDTPARVRHIIDRAEATAACRVHPVGAVTVGLGGRELAPIADMARAGARMFSDDGKCVDNPALLRSALAVGVPVAQHAQCGHLAGCGQINAGHAAEQTGLPPWPGVGEETIVARDVVLAAETGGRLHICHVSTARTVEIVRWAKRQGWPVTAEVTPHHLLLTDHQAATSDTVYKVNPPLRKAEDVAALREALLDGTIDAVATDHAPHTAESKQHAWCHAPFGMIGLATALPVVVQALVGDGEPDWPLIAEVMSHRPARIGGISAIAGRPLRTGESATFTLVDPHAQWTVSTADDQSRSSNTPFRGLRLRHRIVATVVDGHITADRRTARPPPLPGSPTAPARHP